MDSANVSSSLFSIIGNLIPEFYIVWNLDIGDWVWEFIYFVSNFLFNNLDFNSLADSISSTFYESILSLIDCWASEF